MVMGLIEQYREELEDEFGKFTTVPIPDTMRVLLIPEVAESKFEGFVCYLSDPHADARLIVDDYVPEMNDGRPAEEVPNQVD